jgi:hypothetical protein
VAGKRPNHALGGNSEVQELKQILGRKVDVRHGSGARVLADIGRQKGAQSQNHYRNTFLLRHVTAHGLAEAFRHAVDCHGG